MDEIYIDHYCRINFTRPFCLKKIIRNLYKKLQIENFLIKTDFYFPFTPVETSGKE